MSEHWFCMTPWVLLFIVAVFDVRRRKRHGLRRKHTATDQSGRDEG